MAPPSSHYAKYPLSGTLVVVLAPSRYLHGGGFWRGHLVPLTSLLLTYHNIRGKVDFAFPIIPIKIEYLLWSFFNPSFSTAVVYYSWPTLSQPVRLYINVYISLPTRRGDGAELS